MQINLNQIIKAHYRRLSSIYTGQTQTHIYVLVQLPSQQNDVASGDKMNIHSHQRTEMLMLQVCKKQIHCFYLQNHCFRLHECVCACERERESVCVCVCVCMCVHVCERERECVCVCVCVCERERGVCVCVCVVCACV